MSSAWIIFAAMSLQTADTASQERKVEPSTERRIVKEVVVDASQAVVWRRWTTEEGVAKFAAPKSKIELMPGGMFEWYFAPDMPEGQRGSEGCTVMSCIPGEMIAFTWNAPPSIPDLREAGAHTQVVVRFTAIDADHTRVRLTQNGMGEGESWDKYFTYFDRAWGHLLDSLAKSFASEKAEREAAPTPRVWNDGQIKVTAVDGPARRQEFELTIDAPQAKVWSALTTTEGFRRYVGVPEPEIELKPGGAYRASPDATNKVLAFLPEEMLSFSGSAPPQFPNVRKGGTWGAYFLAPTEDGRTHIRLVVVGWKEHDAEHDAAFDYYLKNNPLFLKGFAERLQTEPRP